MQPRLSFSAVNPEGYQAIINLDRCVGSGELESPLLKLVKVRLTLAIITINGWNRLVISFRMVLGSYKARRVETIPEHT